MSASLSSTLRPPVLRHSEREGTESLQKIRVALHYKMLGLAHRAATPYTVSLRPNWGVWLGLSAHGTSSAHVMTLGETNDLERRNPFLTHRLVRTTETNFCSTKTKPSGNLQKQPCKVRARMTGACSERARNRSSHGCDGHATKYRWMLVMASTFERCTLEFLVTLPRRS